MASSPKKRARRAARDKLMSGALDKDGYKAALREIESSWKAGHLNRERTRDYTMKVLEHDARWLSETTGRRINAWTVRERIVKQYARQRIIELGWPEMDA